MSGQLTVHRPKMFDIGGERGKDWTNPMAQHGSLLCASGLRSVKLARGFATVGAAICCVRNAIGALRPLPHFKSVAVFAGVLRSLHYLPGKLGVRTLREAGNEIASCDLRPLRVVQQIGKETDLVEKAILVLRVLLLR